MTEEKQQEKLPNRIVVKLDHINPDAFATIKINLLEDRGVLRGAEMFAAYPILKAYSSKDPIYLAPAGIAIMGRELALKWYKESLSEIIQHIKQTGLLKPEFEKEYPKGWINPTNIAKTHPAFFVNNSGNLVFLKNSRQEYYRYKYQKKIGRSVWRWRAYVEPPLAPEKVKDWAKLKLQKTMEKIKGLKPRPIPRPLPVPVGANKRRN
ncbi:hypothetical protein HY989_03930 [Candidatus Micrarchaeota archaeon]|nr:hypothetical protein [Candidatus Micrarchaeota archaeon]